jgi:hypothetical protein
MVLERAAQGHRHGEAGANSRRRRDAVPSRRQSASQPMDDRLRAAFSPFSNRHYKCKHFLSCFSCFLALSLSFVRPRRRLSSAPTTVSRRRRAQKLSRPAVALTWPHAPPFPGRALTASSTAADWMITVRNSAGFSSVASFGFRSLGLMSLPDPPFSTRSRVSGRTMAPRVSTPLCSRRTQQKIGAGKIARSSRPVPAGTTFRREMRRMVFDRLRRLEMQLQRSIGTSCPWSTSDAG